MKTSPWWGRSCVLEKKTITQLTCSWWYIFPMLCFVSGLFDLWPLLWCENFRSAVFPFDRFCLFHLACSIDNIWKVRRLVCAKSAKVRWGWLFILKRLWRNWKRKVCKSFCVSLLSTPPIVDSRKRTTTNEKYPQQSHLTQSFFLIRRVQYFAALTLSNVIHSAKGQSNNVVPI